MNDGDGLEDIDIEIEIWQGCGYFSPWLFLSYHSIPVPYLRGRILPPFRVTGTACQPTRGTTIPPALRQGQHTSNQRGASKPPSNHSAAQLFR
jgi:hypothetical protein